MMMAVDRAKTGSRWRSQERSPALAAAGVARVEMLDEDTYAQPDRFFSYRRSCHRGEAGYGRQMSMIGVPE